MTLCTLLLIAGLAISVGLLVWGLAGTKRKSPGGAARPMSRHRDDFRRVLNHASDEYLRQVSRTIKNHRR
jgi:hypothetical protein